MSCSQLKEDNDAQIFNTSLMDNWDNYFEQKPSSEFKGSDPVYNLIISLYNAFTTKKSLYTSRKYQNFTECYVDIQQLMIELQCDTLNVFSDDPMIWHGTLSLALNQILKNRIVTRVYNFPNVIAIRQLRSHDIGHFISVKGIVLSIQGVKILLLKSKFICSTCDESQYINHQDGIFNHPKQCLTSNCKSHLFVVDKNQCITSLYQRIIIQEIDSNDDSLQNVGRMPLTIEVELRDNIVSTFITGDHLLINGVLKTEQDDQKGNQKTYNGIYSKYVLASSVFDISKDKEDIYSNDEQPLTEQENDYVNKMIKEGVLFTTLIKSLCPAIYGQDLVKAGVLLCIIGGSKMSFDCRQNSHCLLIGDPGQGKSQILKFVSLVSPKTIYVCGTGTSQCGLTCSINKKDDDGGNIDAGALVLADNGVCCIDEFDKMQNEHSALLEAMEQQTVSIAKSGVLCQFQARASIIASANPTYGHYQKNKSFIDNLKIQNSVLSRFDLIFLMLDQPDPQRDQKLSQHILRMHNPVKRNRSQFDASQESNPYDLNLQEGSYQSLRDRLYQQVNQIQTPLSIRMMKKILIHIKINLHPTLSPEAGKILQDYYIKLRQQTFICSASLPITTRQLESLIRLSQAKARYEFRDIVSVEDAQFIVQLVEESKFECFMDFEEIQSQRRNKLVVDKTNIGNLSKPKQTQIYLEQLHQKGKQNNCFIFTTQQMKDEARSMSMQIGDFGEFIEQLNVKGLILQKEVGKYELKYNQI